MSTLAENLRLALNSGNPHVRVAALRTLEELVPRIEDKRLLSELRSLLSKIAEDANPSAKESLSHMIELVDSYCAVAA